MKRLKGTLIWAAAILITLGASVYQRMTGPTHPKSYQVTIEGNRYRFEVPRSHGGPGDARIAIRMHPDVEGRVIYRRFPTGESWDTVTMKRKGDTLTASLPHQPPAGKLEYHLELIHHHNPVDLQEHQNNVIRFKGWVPRWALVPHVILMFLAMLWSNATGLQAVFRVPSYRRNMVIAIVLFATGGLIFGPIVQKYAFGQFWTGWPAGEDLTDNKVLFSAIAWFIAWWFNRKKERPWLAALAAAILFAAYMIPHSMNGSEYNYESKEVITGMLLGASIWSDRMKPGKKRQDLPHG